MEHIMSRHARLEARIPPEVHALLKRAAEIEGRTMTDFVVSAASAAARHAIEEIEIMRLSREGQEAFAQALLNPPKAAPAMERAIRNRERLLSPE
jgi:uncharacterized protein (DUF1778 family)